MEQSRKNLKMSSIVLLIFAGLSLLHLVTQLFTLDYSALDLPAGANDTVVLVTQIIIAAISVVFLLPQVYIGVKGLKIAKNPDSSRAHILWAKILFVLGILALISPVVGIFKLENVLDNILTVIRVAAEVILYFEYIRSATAIANGN